MKSSLEFAPENSSFPTNLRHFAIFPVLLGRRVRESCQFTGNPSNLGNFRMFVSWEMKIPGKCKL